MKLVETTIPGVVVIEPVVHGDSRGWFLEAYNRERFAAAGLPTEFPQANTSRSARGVLRGLHHQWPKPQGKLVWVVEGAVWDVAVDVRRGSATFGQWYGVELSADNHRMIYVPPGCLHGFQVLSEYATFSYLVTELYDPACDRGIAWNDPDIGAHWPLPEPILSAKDRAAPRLRDVPAEWLPGDGARGTGHGAREAGE
ncbi:MAG: dTDP-4-dehydrorhamnose 3,5-epimerase [Xanthomonadales bacterium]|nr:dTDP-4-dehydrorhamnose 3,5-epimerase [Xanthomonadales bacterium]MCC6594070.1 dTDP-4-dehydrorhamnose 3,5-epimerase [Xanthomonadales bacterium]MCE7930900.1 dTDP-4-dehydrorhamnose 3,5-epimerase [Xanthomonadales bacterium PRO6]